MSRPVSVHLRRQVLILNWIGESHPDCRVKWRSVEIGTWGDIRAKWSVAGERVRFSFQARNRKTEGWVNLVESGRGGARIELRCSARGVGESLLVSWDEDVPPPNCHADTFREAVIHWLRERNPGCAILSIVRRSERAHSLSGAYLRIHARHGGKDHLVIATPDGRPLEDAGPMLTQAILWLHRLRRLRRLCPSLPVLLLVAPAGGTDVLFHRAGFLDGSLCTVEVWGHGYRVETGREFRPAPPPPPPEEHRDFKWPVRGPYRWSPQMDRILDLAPNSIRRYPRFQEYDSLRINGLEFARVHGAGRDRIRFGCGPGHTELTDENFDALRRLVGEILYYRRADSPDTGHAYYRLQSERWLESLILDDVSFLFPELVPEEVYSQIPVYLGTEAGRVDILGADREGTLVVMELKVSESANLPLQALDYWGRVAFHNRRGDFERRGYFGEIRIDRRPPKIYLVSPVFSFHDSTERILGSLIPDLEVWKVAVNEDWRSGVKVMSHIKLKCGDLG